MQIAVAILGGLIVILGITGVVSPGAFRSLLSGMAGQTTWILAVVMRLVLGTLLLMAADLLKYPVVINVLGWISIVAAVVILLMGPERLEKLIGWWMARSDALLRVGTLFAAVFGAFLVYVAV